MADDKELEEPGFSKPVAEHAWLKKLIGKWRVEAEMMSFSGGTFAATGEETVTSFGELWVLGEGRQDFEDGNSVEYRSGYGFDLTFRDYRAFYLMSVSSHLWKYAGTLSDDEKTLTLIGEGPDMTSDGGTSNYKNVIELVDEDHRTVTMYGETSPGEWTWFSTEKYTRVS